MRRCVIFGGGEISDQRFARNLIMPDDYIICADSGYSYCSQMGIVPQLVLGDFDSYRGDVSKECEIIRYDTQKDDTDTMLAVKAAIERGMTDLLLLGMTGGRLDHTLANIQTMAYAVQQDVQVTIRDKNCFLTALKSGQEVTLPYQPRFTVSVFSQTDVSTGVSIRGARYELEDQTLTNTFPLGVSNAFLPNKDITVHLDKGLLIVISNKEN